VQPSERHNQLLQILNDPASTLEEINEARRELQGGCIENEDALIEMYLADPGKVLRRRDPRYDGTVIGKTCGLMCVDACLFFKDRAEAEQSILALNDLIERTRSQVVSDAALTASTNTRRVWELE
jgi:hypothetical protein